MNCFLYVSFLASPSVTIKGGKTFHTVSVGGNLTLDCIGTGIPQPKVQWSRVVSPMSQPLTSKGGLLVIRNAQHFHAGTYNCKVSNRAGSVHAQVVILVQGFYLWFPIELFVNRVVEHMVIEYNNCRVNPETGVIRSPLSQTLLLHWTRLTDL